MRTTIGAFALFATVAFATGCDTEQPLQADAQTADILFRAPSAQVAVYDTWVIWDDRNGNSISDDDYDGDGDDDEFLWCAVPSGAQFRRIDNVPWPFTVEVSRIRAGSQEIERLTSAAATRDMQNRIATTAASITPYDTKSTPIGSKSAIVVTHPAGHCTDNLDLVCDPTNPRNRTCVTFDAGTCVRDRLCTISGTACTTGADCAGGGGTCTALAPDVTRTFRFKGGRNLSGGHRDVVGSRTNPLFELEPEQDCVGQDVGLCTTSGTTQPGTCNVPGTSGPVACNESATVPRYGRCPGTDFGDARIDAGPIPLSVGMETGDTIIVRARRLERPVGMTSTEAPDLATSFLLDGLIVDVDGTTLERDDDPVAGVSFSFTSR